jgi:hypothetical protein
MSVHPQAMCESKKRRPPHRASGLSRTCCPGRASAPTCNICDHTFIENDVIVGDRVTVKCGVQLWDGVRIEDDCLHRAQRDFCERPLSAKQAAAKEISRHARQSGCIDRRQRDAACRESRSAAARWSAPARSSSNRCRRTPSLPAIRRASSATAMPERHQDEPAVRTETARVGKSRVRGVFVERLRRRGSARQARGRRGRRVLPFKVKRFFIVHGVPGREVRGQHAHLVCHQFLACIRGAAA